MTQSDDSGRASLHYRAYLPAGIGLIVAVLVISALFPLQWLAVEADAPFPLIVTADTVISLLVTNVLLARDVALSSEGRLTVTGFGQHIDVDVRRLTTISLSAGARSGFGFARIQWDGGGVRIWQIMTYVPDPRHKYRKSRTTGSEDFRDLVYRLHLINPAVKIRGVEPPSWTLPVAAPSGPADERYVWRP
ncbi:hypothetical protein [Actinomadura roseirufa]|uniref:hypothetical protein n=1 Tax=Actinomadura roseirufa TaxID=2094049 RepID=UPI0010413615|nr:hypothetical protein [Actinomadura roseirufa]